MATNAYDQKVPDRRELRRKLEAAGWGVFFVWIGVAVFLDIGWGPGLIGVGLIMLLGQAGRKYFGIETETFSIVCGSCLILGGLWMLSAIQLHLTPVVCVVAGLALLVSALVRRSRA